MSRQKAVNRIKSREGLDGEFIKQGLENKSDKFMMMMINAKEYRRKGRKYG